MGKFDTHGGYFAPQGYMRVNEGGSHSENPNGGVQLGMDNQGIPNLLEENESVYNDFVYSDNISANKEMLKKYNIPEKYAGKLFSEIADKFVEEAEERPNDPISNNGLNAMLVRLADAQEEQKQIAEQKSIEKELKNLSPEEQEMLLQQLSQQQAPEAQGVQQQISQNQPQMMEQQMQPEMQGEMVAPEQLQQPVMANGGLMRKFDEGGQVPPTGGYSPVGYDPQGILTYQPPIPLNVNTELQQTPKSGILLNPETGTGYAMQGYVAPDGSVQVYDTIQPSVAVAFPGKTQAWVDAEVGDRSIKRQVTDGMNQFAKDAYAMYKDNPAAQIMTGIPGMVIEAVGNAVNGDYGDAALAAALLPVARLKHPINTAKAMSRLYRMNSGARETARAAKAQAKYVEAELASRLNNKKYQAKKAMKNMLGVTAATQGAELGYTTYQEVKGAPKSKEAFDDSRLTYSLYPTQNDTTAVRQFSEGGDKKNVKELPVNMRYAGVGMNMLQGLYNITQSPDKYRIRNYVPQQISGHMALTNPVYRPVDMNILANDVQATGAGTARAIRNSGLGASTAAALLANGYNTTKSLGNARQQVSELNNQNYNNVIQMRNANAQTLGNFQYNIDAANTQAINNARLTNIQNDLKRQQLNYAAEGEKYAAISKNLDVAAQDLSNIGKENMSFNMVNFNPALNYGLSKDGRVVFTGAKGGKLNKTNKK